MALQSNDINDLNRNRIIESSEVPGQPGIVALNPDGSSIGSQNFDVTLNANYAQKVFSNVGAITDGIVWSPPSNKRWNIITMYIQVSADCTVTIEDDKSSGDRQVFKSEFAAKSGSFLVYPEKYPLSSEEDGADLIITTTTGNIYVTITGFEI